MSRPITIADYDPQWPILYQQEKARILGVIGLRIAAVEHVGSTAVPGLGAKPIIDIMVAVHQLADAAQCIEPLQSIGYEYVPEYEAVMPERRYFHKPGGPEWRFRRTHHLHMVEITSDFWELHLLFRDYLRAHPEVAQHYYALKVELAARFGLDRDGYTEAKTAFIRSVEAAARAAKAATRQAVI